MNHPFPPYEKPLSLHILCHVYLGGKLASAKSVHSHYLRKKTWRYKVSSFLQHVVLSMLSLNNPYLAKNYQELVNFLTNSNPRNSRAISNNHEDLFCSLEQGKLKCSVKEAIKEYIGEFEFTQHGRMALQSFLELWFYLNTIAKWSDGLFVQKTGMFSRVAPVLSDLYLSHENSKLQENLKDLAGSAFRYVDNYLVFFARNNNNITRTDIFKVFCECGNGLDVTLELINDNCGY